MKIIDQIRIICFSIIILDGLKCEILFPYDRCTILFDRDGNSISSAGEWPNSDQDICAAVAANIWLTLEKASRINPNAIQVNI